MKFKRALSSIIAGIMAITSSVASISPTAFAADGSAQTVIDSLYVNGWDSFDVDLRSFGIMNQFTTVTIACETDATEIVGDDEKAPETAFGVVINDNWDLATMPRCGYNPSEMVFEMTLDAEQLENNPVFKVQSQLPEPAIFTVTVDGLTADNRAAISLAPLSENVTLNTYDASDWMDGGNCYGSVSIPAKNISGDYAITYGETTVRQLRENVKYISTSANPYYGDSLDEGAGAFNYNVAIVCGNGVVASTMSSEDSFDLTSPGTTYIDDLCTNELDSFVVSEIIIEISAKLFWNDEISKNQAVSDKIRLAKPNTPIQLEIVEDTRIELSLPAIDKYSMVLTAEEGQDWLIGSYAYADYIVPDPVGKTYGNTTIGALRSVLKRFNTTANTYVSDSLNAGEDSFEYCIDMEANNGEDYVRFANDSFRLTESGFVYVDNFDYNGTKISSGTYDDYVITAFIIKVQSALGWDDVEKKSFALCEDIRNMNPGDTLTLNLKKVTVDPTEPTDDPTNPTNPTNPTTPTSTNPVIGGSSKSWSDVAADLGKLTNSSEATIELNGNATVPVDVIKSIADKDIKATFVINSANSWIVDGADITAPAAADLTFIKTASTKSNGLRGTEGTQFKINNTGVPTSLEISFKKEHEGKFANLYKSVDGKLKFVTCAKLGEDGKVILPDVVEKGDYVAMLCEFSDRLGDMDNDGTMNAKDTSAILMDIVGIEPGKNPLMADFNGDGRINAMDAAAILKRIVGLA